MRIAWKGEINVYRKISVTSINTADNAREDKK